MTTKLMTRAHRTRFAGMTLVELMVALAIGSFLLLGAVTVFMQGRSTFRTNENVARLQENARFVLDAIEPDIRMAHYFGLTTRAGKITNRASQSDPHAGLGPSSCANNWAVDLDNAVEGTNGAYPWACAATGNHQAGSDTITIRRVEEDALPNPPAPAAGTMYLQSWRLQPGQIFTGSPVPTSDSSSSVHELVVNGYYVSDDSSLSTPDNDVPSLRVKTLVPGPAIQDQEVLPGVEDMQIQFGVDTDAVDMAGRGVVDRFVDADHAIITPGAVGFIPDAEILAVRVWVRVRAERPEVGYENTTNYVYADENFTASDSFRRAVVSKTIYLRNARPAS